jgi:hypothetical protein
MTSEKTGTKRHGVLSVNSFWKNALVLLKDKKPRIVGNNACANSINLNSLAALPEPCRRRPDYPEQRHIPAG